MAITYKLSAEIKLKGDDESCLVNACKEVLRLLEEGYTSGENGNVTDCYSFIVRG